MPAWGGLDESPATGWSRRRRCGRSSVRNNTTQRLEQKTSSEQNKNSLASAARSALSALATVSRERIACTFTRRRPPREGQTRPRVERPKHVGCRSAPAWEGVQKKAGGRKSRLRIGQNMLFKSPFLSAGRIADKHALIEGHKFLRGASKTVRKASPVNSSLQKYATERELER